MYNDDHILYDELERKRNQRGGLKRKALRLPLHAPGSHRDEQRAEDTDEQKEERGVRVLDMCNGYSVVE